ncbi:MAG: NAD-dependent epimerase/dehydratase family protein [bacterium]
MPRRALVTGATGFIGRWLARALIARGDAVVATARNAAERPELAALVPNAAWLDADILDAGTIFRAIKSANPDVIFHLAAGTAGTLAELEAANIGGIEAVLRAVARGAKPGGAVRVVTAGSASEYGAVPFASLPIREDAVPAPVGDYGASKLAATRRALELGDTLGVSVTVARIFNVTGPGEPERLVFGRLARAIVQAERAGAPAEVAVGSLGATRDIIDVRDVADALIAVSEMTSAESAAPPIVNVGSGVESLVREHVARILALARVGVRTREPEDAAPLPPARHVADVSLLAAAGFRARIALNASARDLLDEARAQAGERDRNSA